MESKTPAHTKSSGLVWLHDFRQNPGPRTEMQIEVTATIQGFFFFFLNNHTRLSAFYGGICVTSSDGQRARLTLC